MIKNNEWFYRSALILGLGFLSGCGGSGGVESRIDSSQPDHSGQSSASRGVLYYQNANGLVGAGNSWLVRQDLTNATTASVLNLKTLANSISVSDDARFISVVDAGQYDASIYKDGNLHHMFRSNSDVIHSHILISPSNKHWMFIWHDMNLGKFANRLIIGNKDNPKALVIEGGARDYDWYSDDEILFIQDDGIARLKGLGLNGGNVGNSEWLVRFPGETPTRMSISPDKNQVALVKTDYSHYREPSAVFVMDIDGGGERQITEWGASIGGVEWSPDGSQVAVGSAANYGQVCNYVFILPVNSDRLPIIDLNGEIAPATLVRDSSSKPVCVQDEYTFSWRSQ